MQLNDLKPAWKQMKLLNAMPHLDADEVLSIIEHPDNVKRGKLLSVCLNVAMFIVIAFCCQGG